MVKDLFFSPDEAVMQLHPSMKDYVNYHPRCLHLWRPQTSQEILDAWEECKNSGIDLEGKVLPAAPGPIPLPNPLLVY